MRIMGMGIVTVMVMGGLRKKILFWKREKGGKSKQK